MSAAIRTVCGDIAPSALGFCHCHEHILLAKGKSFEVNPVICMPDKEKSLEELTLFRSAGGCSVVDAQPVGCGRMAPELAEISARSGVHIVASTGFHRMLYYYGNHWVFSHSEDALTKLFIKEIAEGCAFDCDRHEPQDYSMAKAGVIKTALDVEGLDKQYEKLFTAAAQTARETGAAILIHIQRGSDPIMLDDFLTMQGVAHEKRIYCHMDKAIDDLGIHRELCGRGSYLEYDCIHCEKYHSDEMEAKIILAMAEAGYVRQILLGLDTTNVRQKAYGGEIGLDYIKERFIPLALRTGLTVEAFEDIMIHNPAQALANDF